jgi:enoyl-[acyl-carrier protein] reductase II
MTTGGDDTLTSTEKEAGMRTRVTELFGIDHPILLSGMSWISTPELVAAVADAGGLGILASGVMDAAQTRDAVRQTRELTDRPFAANVTLYFPGNRDNAKVLIDEQVPVVNYSLGKGDWICDGVHAYGGKVVATVATEKHALAAARDGADALIVTGHEAAGHGGRVTSLVLVPALSDAVELPLIAAGGFADGRGLAAALALGADGVAMGTRFMNTVESPAHEAAKRASVEHRMADTVYTNRVDGLHGRYVDAAGARKLVRQRLNPASALMRSRQIARMLGLPWAKLAAGIVLSGYAKSVQMARMAIGFEAFKDGCTQGDLDRGVLPLGQCTGLIDDTPTVAEVVHRIVDEAESVLERLQRAHQPSVAVG